jgi:uncharacterized protein (DUF1697 family)
MTYVALLRGVNVGGNRKVDMRQLTTTFAGMGYENVRTYINSGNVVFDCSETPPVVIVAAIEAAIESDFGFPVKVLLRDAANVRALVEALDPSWVNDQSAKCDVMFLADEVDRPEVLSQVTVKPDIDDVRYVPGALLWRVGRPNVTRSGMLKIVGTELYAQMTVRNCNTVRKLDALMRRREPHE